MSNSFFDQLLPVLRNEYTWVPLYIFMLIFSIFKSRSRGSIWAIMCVLTVVLSDLTSSHLIKKTICRPRPCHIQEELTDMVLRVSCGTGYSFTSSHASNHMALAAFIILTGTLIFGKWRWLFLPWAFLIGFAQIYVGVHYPFDVLAGFILGGLIAVVVHLLYNSLPTNLKLPTMSKSVV